MLRPYSKELARLIIIRHERTLARMFHESASGGPRIWPSFLTSTSVPSTGSPRLRSGQAGQAHPATYHSGTPQLRFWISDLGSRILTTIDDIERNSSDFTICSQSLTNFYANFQSALRNPHSSIVDPVAQPSWWSRDSNS